MKKTPKSGRIAPQFISLVALHLVRNFCQAQNSPYFETPTFAANVTHRSSYCFMYEKIYQGNLERRDGLRGKNVSIGLLDLYLDSDTGGIDDNAIAVRFLDELARRAGFEWRNSYGVLEAPTENNNYTWNDLMLWGTDVYDVMGEWMVKTLERLEMGIDYVDSWYDGSMIMVMVKNKEEFQWFTFLQPFSWQVWMLMGFSMVFYAISYYLIDYLDSRRKSVAMEASLGSHMFYAPYAFTGHSLYHPRTFSTRLSAFSLCFMCLVLLAIYTANMASLLVNKNNVFEVVNTLDDAIKGDMTICVWKTAATDNFLLLYHKEAKRLPCNSEVECAAALVRGDCQVYLTYGNTWEILKRDVKFNEDCRLDWVGRRVTQTDASFVVQDSLELCSKLLEDVLTIHMVDMKIDGTFFKIWSDYYSATSSHDCNVENDDIIDEELNIGLKQIGSLFILYFTLIIIALIVALVRCYFIPKEKKKMISKELRCGVKNPNALRKAAAKSYRNMIHITKTNEEHKIHESISNKNEENYDKFHTNSSNILQPIEDSLNAGLSDKQAQILKALMNNLIEAKSNEHKSMMIDLIETNKQKDD